MSKASGKERISPLCRRRTGQTDEPAIGQKDGSRFQHPRRRSRLFDGRYALSSTRTFWSGISINKNQLIAYRTLTVGTIDASLAKSREVFNYALRYNAAAVILVHNHPSGNPEPSKNDIRVTQRIVEVGHIMEIPVLDHIIIGDGIFVSLCERGDI